MSVLYTVILLTHDEGLQNWLLEQGVDVPKDIRPARWPTLAEISAALDQLVACKTWEFGGGSIEIVSKNNYQTLYLMPPYPVKPEETVDFYLRGYCKEIIEPLLDELSTICGSMIVVENSNAKVVYQTS